MVFPKFRVNANSSQKRSIEEDSRQRKKIKIEPGVEDEQYKIPPPLIPFTESGVRFHTIPQIDLTRSYVDLTYEGKNAGITRIPVSLIPQADIEGMSRLPIVQSPEDPTQAHSELPQPASINFNVKPAGCGNYEKLAYTARDQMHQLLQDPSKRKNHERTHFSLKKITPENFSRAADINPNHPTMNMRGVVAAKPIKAGTPIQYSAQYMDEAQWLEGVEALSQKLQSEANMSKEQADKEADRLLISYSWEGTKYKGKDYHLSAFGAGNIAAMVNHDNQTPNMGIAYLSTYDEHGQPAPRIVAYFALRDIEEGEQLLVDYGEYYQFDTPLEGSQEAVEENIVVKLDETRPHSVISASLRQAIAAKPSDEQVLDLNDSRLYDYEATVADSLTLEGKYLSTTPEQDALLPDGYHWHDPSRDGNCLFHALKRKFPELGVDHAEIRQVLAHSAAAIPDDSIDEKFRQEFIEAVNKPGEYGGSADSAIHFAALVFDIHITAYKEKGAAEERHFGPDAATATRTMTLASAHNHFFLMEPIPVDDTVQKTHSETGDDDWQEQPIIDQKKSQKQSNKKQSSELGDNPKLKKLEKPKGFDKLARSHPERRKLIKRARRAASALGVAPPEWTVNKKRGGGSSLEKPIGYDDMDPKEQGTYRSRARIYAEKKGLPEPEWAAQKLTHRESILEPPEGYEDMLPNEQSGARTATRNSAIRQGIPVPDWAVQRKRSSARELPENYVNLKVHQQRAARSASRKAAKREGKEDESWAIKRQRESALEKPANYDNLKPEAQRNARARSRNASERLKLPIQDWAKIQKRTDILSKPEGYDQMPPEKQDKVRFSTRNAALKKGVDVPEWAKKK